MEMDAACQRKSMAATPTRHQRSREKRHLPYMRENTRLAMMPLTPSSMSAAVMRSGENDATVCRNGSM